MSFSTTWSFMNPAYTPIYNAYNAGIVCVASAGNDGHVTGLYPIGWGETVGVGSSDRTGNRAVFDASHSSNDVNVDIWAPGVVLAVATTPSQNSWEYEPGGSGTSYSSPIVAGVIADCMAQGTISNSTYSQNVTSAISRLQNTAYNLNVGKVLNAKSAAGQ